MEYICVSYYCIHLFKQVKRAIDICAYASSVMTLHNRLLVPGLL